VLIIIIAAAAAVAVAVAAAAAAAAVVVAVVVMVVVMVMVMVVVVVITITPLPPIPTISSGCCFSLLEPSITAALTPPRAQRVAKWEAASGIIDRITAADVGLPNVNNCVCLRAV
jgi:hypothetical protein